MLDGKTLFNEKLRFDVATAAIKGGRDYQEDSLIASFPVGQDTGFAVLADGMGGHLAGDVASALVMSEVFTRLKLKELVLDDETLDIPAMLNDAAQAANARINQHIEDDPETHGMGSTLLTTVIRGEDLYWISIGDSPLYLYRDGAMRQLNKDHSMAPQIDMMVKVGAMDPEVGRNHPDRNTLTSAIAGINIEKIDCPEEPTALLPGDILVVASDGLQFLSNEVIEDILRANEARRSVDITNALLAALDDLDDPEQDNTAMTVIKLGEMHKATQPIPMHQTPVFVRSEPKPTLEPKPQATMPESAPARATEAAPAQSATTPQEDSSDTSEASPTTRIVRLVASSDRRLNDVSGSSAHADDPILEPHALSDRQTYWYRGHKYVKD